LLSWTFGWRITR